MPSHPVRNALARLYRRPVGIDVARDGGDGLFPSMRYKQVLVAPLCLQVFLHRSAAFGHEGVSGFAVDCLLQRPDSGVEGQLRDVMALAWLIAQPGGQTARAVNSFGPG